MARINFDNLAKSRYGENLIGVRGDVALVRNADKTKFFRISETGADQWLKTKIIKKASNFNERVVIEKQDFKPFGNELYPFEDESKSLAIISKRVFDKNKNPISRSREVGHASLDKKTGEYIIDNTYDYARYYFTKMSANPDRYSVKYDRFIMGQDSPGFIVQEKTFNYEKGVMTPNIYRDVFFRDNA